MEISKRATGLVAAVGAALVLYGVGGRVVDYAKHFFSSEPDKNANIFEEKHYTASGRIVNVTKTEGAYLLETEIAAGEETEQDALGALGCVSTCKRTLYINAKSINEEYKSDLEKIARADLKVWDGMLALQGTFFVTETQQGQAYMAAVQSVAIDVTEKRLVSYHRSDASPSSSNDGNKPGLFDKIKPYLPYIMKYIDVEDVAKVNRIIENLKDGALDGLEALSERINWKKYNADKEAGRIDDRLERVLLRVVYEPPNTLAATVRSEVKTEDIIGVLVGGKQYGSRVKLKVSIEDHPELKQDKKGVVTFEVNEHTSLTPEGQALLRSFLGKYTEKGCRTNRCGEYTFSAKILPTMLPGDKYTLHSIEISNSGMKALQDDMEGKPFDEQPEQPRAMRLPFGRGDIAVDVKDEPKKDDDKEEQPEKKRSRGLIDVAAKGVERTMKVVDVMERGFDKIFGDW